MNLRAVGWLLGCMLLCLAGSMLVPAVVSAWFGEREAFEGCMWSAALCAALGTIPAVAWRGATYTAEGRTDTFRREGLAAVGLAWIVGCAAGALPFLFSGVIASPVDALFESASGLTTTGSTILAPAAIDAMPLGIAFWRSFSQWLGGLAVVVVFGVLFPAGGRSLFRSEVPGIGREALRHRVRASVVGLTRAYVALTLAQVAWLWLAGLRDVRHPLYESFVHAFGTLATGGFSNHSAGVAFFGSWKVELVLVVFMLAAGLRFDLYDTLLRQGPRRAWQLAARSTEVRLYAALLLGASAVVTLVLWFWGGSNGDPASELRDYSSLGACLRDGVLAVVNAGTTTGFTHASLDRWPDSCRLLLLVLMIFGACAGSTGGGLKVIRLAILAKAALASVQRFSRPRAIHSLRVDGQVLPDAVASQALAYCGLWLVVFLLGTWILCGLGLRSSGIHPDEALLTAATAVIATLNNVGPGLGAVGPGGDFGFLPDAAKLLLAFLMVLGRLELYAVAVLFVPRFWRQ